MLGLEAAGGYGRIGIVVVLGGVVEMVFFAKTFVAIAAGDGIADEFDLSGGEGGGLNEPTAWIEHESPELREELITFDDIHQTDEMTAVGQGGGKGDQGVALAPESDLEGLCLIYLGHEIAAAGLGEHPAQPPPLLRWRGRRSLRVTVWTVCL